MKGMGIKLCFSWFEYISSAKKPFVPMMIRYPQPIIRPHNMHFATLAPKPLP